MPSQRKSELTSGQLRGYYEHLALVHQHYLEVDSLLAGELPSAIVQSFAGRHRAEWGDADDEGTGDTPGWVRQSSAWKLQQKRNSIENVMGNGHDPNSTYLNDEGEDEERGRLLPVDIEEREAKRERIAKIALNGESAIPTHAGEAD